MTLDLMTLGLGLVAAALGYLLYRLVTCTESLEWYDLVATNKKLNAYKLGYWVGSIIGGWVVVKGAIDSTLSGEIFGVYLAFLGGVNVVNSIGRSLERNPGGRGYRYSPDRDFSAGDEDQIPAGRPPRVPSVQERNRSAWTTRGGKYEAGKRKPGRGD